jgi:hypothetical protein
MRRTTVVRLRYTPHPQNISTHPVSPSKMNIHTNQDRWISQRNPILATLATNHARPQLLSWLLGSAGIAWIVAMLSTESIGQRNAAGVAIAVWSVVAFACILASCVGVGTQTLIDRDRGVFEQYRLAGADPTKVFLAYVLGPQWVALLLPLLTSFVVLPLCFISRESAAPRVLALATATLTVTQCVFGDVSKNVCNAARQCRCVDHGESVGVFGVCFRNHLCEQRPCSEHRMGCLCRGIVVLASVFRCKGGMFTFERCA